MSSSSTTRSQGPLAVQGELKGRDDAINGSPMWIEGCDESVQVGCGAVWCGGGVRLWLDGGLFQFGECGL